MSKRNCVIVPIRSGVSQKDQSSATVVKKKKKWESYISIN